MRRYSRATPTPESRGDVSNGATVLPNLSARSAALILCAAVTTAAGAQSTDSTSRAEHGFWARWFRRSDRAKAEQPHWPTPIATTTPRLDQAIRYDISWSQPKPGGTNAMTFGNNKGIELIPLPHLQVITAFPSYIVHHNPATPDGWGDLQLLVKYRFLSANEEHGAYVFSAYMTATLPTATNDNGVASVVLTPSIAYGKGWGFFDVQGTIGAVEPLRNTSTIGRTYNWSNTFQFHVLPHVWPEIEVNRSWFSGGKNDGRSQTFLTPGVMFGKFSMTDRVGLSFGGGVQIAVTQFHTTNHNAIFTVRTPF